MWLHCRHNATTFWQLLTDRSPLQLLTLTPTLEADDVWECVPLGCTLLEGEDDSPIFAEFTNETFLLTQATTEDMGTGKLDHLGQKGSKLTVDHLRQVKEKQDEEEEDSCCT